jgi:hypothetical protein
MRIPRACVALFLAGILAPIQAPAQDAPLRLNIVVVEGDGAINNIRQRTAREPIVQVEDQNHKPVAGAAVVFTLPSSGPSGVFPNGSRILTVTTDNQGRAAARGLRLNSSRGQMQIRVTASHRGQTASAVITQTNIIAVGAAAAAGGISAKLIAIIAVAGAAVAGGVVAATRGGGNGGGATTATTANPPTTVTPGSGTVGAPR